MDPYLRLAHGYEDAMRALKDQLHCQPELSFQEFQTTALLREKLTGLGLELIDLGLPTGVVALLRGALPGPRVALRADIDAIKQQETARATVTSEVPGVMHACGHDLHSAALYGAACLLQEQQASQAGDVLMIFQPAEEETKGAAALLKQGLLAQTGPLTAIYGLHCTPELLCGSIGVHSGAVMAGKHNFHIQLRGRTGHGGRPQECVDVVVAGAALVQGIQTIVSRNSDPFEPLVCAVYSIQAGELGYFVTDKLEMTGSIRAHNPAAIELAAGRLRELAQSTAAAYQCAVEIEIMPEVPVTWNDPDLLASAQEAAAPLGQVVEPPLLLASEDFACYGQVLPSFFYFLGTGFAAGENAPWHHGDFRTDDAALPLGAALLARSARLALGCAAL